MIKLIEDFILEFKYPLKNSDSDTEIDYKCIIAATILDEKYPGKCVGNSALFTHKQLILWSMCILFCNFYFEISLIHAFFLELYILFVLFMR